MAKTFPQAQEFGRPNERLDARTSDARNDFSTQFGRPNGRPNASFPQTKTDRASAQESGWKSRKIRQRKNLRLNAELIGGVEVWCRVNGVMVQDLIDELLALFLRACQTSARGLRFDLIDLIDRLIEDQEGRAPVENSTTSGHKPATEKPATRETATDAEAIRERELLRLYADLSTNRIRESDRLALRDAGDLSDAVIRAGIMRAVLCCSERVGSFAYCLKVARQVAAVGDVEGELTRLREKLLTRTRAGQLTLPLNTERLIFADFRSTEK